LVFYTLAKGERKQHSRQKCLKAYSPVRPIAGFSKQGRHHDRPARLFCMDYVWKARSRKKMDYITAQFGVPPADKIDVNPDFL
jgi:hypothetical protein